MEHTRSSQKRIYKIRDDPRVTLVGRFLRKTSVDEFPQFINVLRGDMSLVGPRPPIPYELENYDIWHRRRVLELKPGITGLWQVQGRSKTSFDEMVRLDMKYIKERSLWLDIKILLQTPFAVFAGKGAY
jgi:lipopolysaccharide/colanic/teichoic acid biosynthesis glycosyltransferase